MLFIRFLVVALVAVGLVFNVPCVKGVWLQLFNKILDYEICIAIVRTFSYNKK